MHSVEVGIRRYMSAAVGALVSPRVVIASDAANSTESWAMFFTNEWTYVITAVVVVLLVGATLAVLLKRRSPPAIIATPPIVQYGVPQQEDSHGAQRARKEELAATSGMLGELLDQYLRSRFHHLLLIYPDTPSLQNRLSEVAGEYAAVSFFYFCKLISLLAECENQGGAMPLLSNQVAHDSAQRLINSFLSSIPQGEEEGSVDTFEIATKFREHRLTIAKLEAQLGTSCSQVGDFVRSVDHKRYVSESTSEETVQDLLVKEFAAYDKWLKLAPPGLILGAEALRAFYKLVSQDLRGADDPRRRIPSSTRLDIADSAALGVLSDKLTTLAVEEILSESPMPRPLGVFLRKVPLRKVTDMTQQAPQSQTKIQLTTDQLGDLLRKAGTSTVAQTQIGTQIIQQHDKGLE
jgi:hypothetical protein